MVVPTVVPAAEFLDGGGAVGALMRGTTGRNPPLDPASLAAAFANRCRAPSLQQSRLSDVRCVGILKKVTGGRTAVLRIEEARASLALGVEPRGTGNDLAHASGEAPMARSSRAGASRRQCRAQRTRTTRRPPVDAKGLPCGPCDAYLDDSRSSTCLESANRSTNLGALDDESIMVPPAARAHR